MVSKHNDSAVTAPGDGDDVLVAEADDEFDEDDFEDDELEDDEDDEEGEEEDDGLPRSHLRSGGSGGFGPAIAGIMHGIDADIFRDPASIQRMQRDSSAVVRTADGTVIGISLPGEGVITDPDSDDEPPAE